MSKEYSNIRSFSQTIGRASVYVAFALFICFTVVSSAQGQTMADYASAPTMGTSNPLIGTSVQNAAGGGNFFLLSNSGTNPIASIFKGVSDISAKPATGQISTFTPMAADADMDIRFALQPVSGYPGTIVDYQILLANFGPAYASNISMTYVMPSGTTLIEFYEKAAPFKYGFICTTPAGGSNGTITCTLDFLVPGAGAVFNMRVRINDNFIPGNLTNTFSVTASEDPRLGNNSATATTPVLATPSMTFTVTRTDDRNNATCAAGDCSLREAIKAVNANIGNNTIQFSSLFNSQQTIILTNGELVLDKSRTSNGIKRNLTINGKGANLTTISGNNASRVLTLVGDDYEANTTISGLTIANGRGRGSDGDGDGGGIKDDGRGTTNVINCAFTNNIGGRFGGGIAADGIIGKWNITGSTFSGNSAAFGGAIYIGDNSVNISNTTISGNTVSCDGCQGGGIYNDYGDVTITNSTITGNTGTGVYYDDDSGGNGSITVKNTIIAGNSGANPDIRSSRSIISNGYNFIGKSDGSTGFSSSKQDQIGTIASPKDPLLLPLANNGGTTQTHALLACSPAIDKGKNFSDSTKDQRGLTRTVNGANYPNATNGDDTDIGSFEVQQPDLLGATAPTVTINQAAGQSDPTGSSPINFTVVFSESVSNFTTDDVTLSGSAGATTATVTGSGAIYSVAVSGMTFDGTVIASINAGVATGNCSGIANTASTSTDNTVQYNAPDTTAPTVTSIDDGDADNTVQINETLTYTVTFSEDINASTVTTSDFDNGATTSPATITIGTITETTPTSGVFTVRVTPTTNGSILLRIPTAADIRDTLNNRLVTPIQHQTIVTVGLFDLTVTKTHTGNFTQGGVGTYTIIAKNSGGGAYSGTILVSDTLPLGLTTKGTPAGTGWNCVTDTLSNAFVCDRTNVLAAGASFPPITATVDVAANAPSSVTNTVRVDGTSESNKTNNTASDLTIINAATTFSISGTMRYGITDAGQTPAAISGVNLNATGAANSSAISNSSGVYQLSNLASGTYTVTPSKSGEIKGINSLDATRIQQYLVGLTTLTPNQLIAANTDGNGIVNSLDATRIQQRAVGMQTSNIIGQWKFVPGNRQYNSLGSNQSGQDYQAVLVGEVSGNWATASSFAEDSPTEEEILPKQDNQSAAAERFENELSEHIAGRTKQSVNSQLNESQTESAVMGSSVTVALPSNAVALSGNTIVIPVSIGEIPAGSSIEAYDFSVFYDASILSPLSPPVSNTGTLSAGCSVFSNTLSAGRVAVSGSCAQALTSGSGTLVNLRFSVIGAGNQQTTLSFTNPVGSVNTFEFNNGTPAAVTTDGQFTVTGPTAALVSISGRVLTTSGRGVGNVQITLTDAAGNERTAMTSSFGYYRFEGVAAGETITLTAKARRFRFNQSSMVRTTSQAIDDADFISEQ